MESKSLNKTKHLQVPFYQSNDKTLLTCYLCKRTLVQKKTNNYKKTDIPKYLN